MCCIDVDAKRIYGNTEVEQKKLCEDVLSTLGINKWYGYVERTQSGGFHIWVLTDKEMGALTVRVEIVEDENGKKTNKKEIEIFTQSRFMIVYDNKINFSDLEFISSERIELLQSMSCEIKEEQLEEIEVNTGKTSEYLKKSYDNIPDLKRFKNGEWPSYNFVKDEVMRFYIALNQEDEFLKLINEHHENFYHVWKHFPKKYLEVTQGNRSPSKNSKHLEWLNVIGYAKKQNRKDNLLDKAEVVFKKISGGSPIRIGDSIFIYNGKSYEWLSPLKFDENIYKYWKEINGVNLKKDEMGELVFQLDMYLKSVAVDYNPADKLNKPNSINLAFKNGTLYIYDDKQEFKENYFNTEDRVMIEFSVDYTPIYEEGLVNEWLNARFDTEEKKKFFKMILGDLFSTSANTDVHGYFWGGAELGKSTFVSLLQNVTTKGTVDLMKLDKIKDKFSRVRTLRTPIMVADESSERNIPESEYKATISREADDYELKNVQNFTGIPIAKIITFGNVLPNIKMDEGVKRRLCTVRIDDKKVATHLGKQEFAEEFGKCGNELIGLIIEGIKECFKIKWDLSGFYKENFREEMESVIFANDSFSHFIKENFKITKSDDDYVENLDAFKIFNAFLETLEGKAVQKMSLIKFGSKLRELGFSKVRKQIFGDRIYCLLGLKHTLKSYELLKKYNWADESERNKIDNKIMSLGKNN